MVNSRTILWWAAFVTGWSIDFFFWEKAPGISFPLFLLLFLVWLFYLSRKEDQKPHPASYGLAAGAVVFAFFTVLRLEPFTRFLNFAAAFGLTLLLILTFQGGRWLTYSLADYVVGGLKLFLNMFGLPISLLASGKEGEKAQEESEKPARGGRRRWIAVVRGLVLAIPVLLILGALLSAADPIFQAWTADLTDWIRLERLPEYILRGVLITIWAFLLAGLLLYALTRSRDQALIRDGDSWPPLLLGMTETSIILGGVNLLFSAFVTIQFRYFFGGKENISLQGYTYSEYARRGFGELLAVAFFTLLLFMVLSATTRRQSPRAKTIFSGLTGLLTVMIGVILVSSLKRLALYEAAYGFTRLRTYSHICMLWIGVLFLALLILEITHHWRFFTLASVLAVLGFILTLNVINVDGFIVRRNLTRARNGETLDVDYFHTLSADAVPVLVRQGLNNQFPPGEEREISAVLACNQALIAARDRPWASFTLPPYRAEHLLQGSRELWKNVITFRRDGGWAVLVGDEIKACRPPVWD